MSLRPPGEDDLGTMYGDMRLNQRARDKGGREIDVFMVKEETGTLNIRCKVCEMTIFGIKNLNSHIAGKKHDGKFTSKMWELVADEEPELVLPEPVAVTSAPLLDLTMVKLSNDGPVLRLLSQYKALPVIGLEYLIEVREGPGEEFNICLLCDQELKTNYIMDHITSPKHRLRYLECFFPIVSRKFEKVPNLDVWEASSFDYLESIISRIEVRCGRQRSVTVLGKEYFENNLKLIKAAIENGTHSREAKGINFRNLPNPFQPYEYKLPKQEVVDISVLFEPISGQGLIVEPRYSSVRPLVFQGLTLHGSEPSYQENDQPNPNLEKFNVMNKIASLRKEINNDDNYNKDIKQNVKDAPNTVTVVKKVVEELDIVSDEDLPDEKDLKLRKPEKRGIRSRNPGGLNSRRDHDKEQEKGEVELAKPNLDSGRTLYMDKEDTDRRKEKDNRSGRDSREQDARSNRDENRNNRIGVKDDQRDKVNKSSGRDDNKNVRSNTRDDNKDRDVRNRDQRSKDSVNERHRSPRGKDSGQRDEKETTSNRSRKRSRSRDRDGRDKSRRNRSISPYVVAMEKWKRFKKAESVMLSNIAKRREIFDKRPEDHPKYGEEWKSFWEKRYKELQAQGKDPSGHDFRAEWIPFWTKRVSQLFDTEVLEKTDDLLKTFELSSVLEPKRLDFVKPESRRSPERSRENRRHREDRRSSRSPGRKGHIRNPSPPTISRNATEGRGNHGPGRHDNNRSPDMYSGITELEDRRDRGRSVEPDHRPNSLVRGQEFNRLDDPQMGAVKVIPCLRLLTALEDTLGSLGPQVNKVLARALSIEQNREGASKILLEDPDTVSILEMVKEKLSGQMSARLLSGSREGAVRVCLDNLTRLLQNATKKRSLDPTSLLQDPAEAERAVTAANRSSIIQRQQQSVVEADTAAKRLIATSIATVVMNTGRSDITDDVLEKLVDELMRQTAGVDTDSAVGKVARSYTETVNAHKRLAVSTANQFNVYNFQPQQFDYLSRQETNNPESGGRDQISQLSRGSRDYNFVPQGQGKQNMDDNKDEFDDLTVDELRSLLDNFQNLSKQEQVDLIAYTKKLEKTNPLKVQQLKSGMWSNKNNDEHEQVEPEVVEIDNDDWTPVNKRSRRLSGSGLDMNPAAPEPTDRQETGNKFTMNNWEEEERDLNGRSTRPGSEWHSTENIDEGPRRRFGEEDQIERGFSQVGSRGGRFVGGDRSEGFNPNQDNESYHRGGHDQYGGRNIEGESLRSEENVWGSEFGRPRNNGEGIGRTGSGNGPINPMLSRGGGRGRF